MATRFTTLRTCTRGWFPVIVLPSLVVAFFPVEVGRWVFMWVLSFAIYVGCKWLTWRRTLQPRATLRRRAGYLLAWPGMDAPAFLDPHVQGRRPTNREWAFAGSKVLLGLGCLFSLRWLPADQPLLQAWVGMIGTVLALHFGVFHGFSCAWRMHGVQAKPLMDWPIAATSVSAFWGQRWNTAFRDLTHRFLFKPLARRWGPRWALAMGFLFSGLIHDLVISVPAGGGYGGPTLFFLGQGVALFVERSAVGQRLGLGRGVRGWLFTAVVLLPPVPLLFHRPFLEQVILPFVGALGVTS